MVELCESNFTLTKGTILSILVGQMGISSRDTGGGGGSFVIYN
jgi:hypothetical protein